MHAGAEEKLWGNCKEMVRWKICKEVRLPPDHERTTGLGLWGNYKEMVR